MDNAINKNLALARTDILRLQPYVHAALAPTLERLHANENPWRAATDPTRAGLNRYPESPPTALHERLSELYGVAATQVLAGRGSDEGIDLLLRTFCRAEHDSVIICPPTFGYYKVAAQVQGAQVIEIPLLPAHNFALDTAAVLAACTAAVKLVFLCAPNNPTGNTVDRQTIRNLCTQLDGRALVVVDEAYSEFSTQPSLLQHLNQHPNLVVLRTLSKAYALAGARCGVVIADAAIIQLLQRVLPPYALPTATIETVLAATEITHRTLIQERIHTLLTERDQLATALQQCKLISRVWPSDANFLLVECHDVAAVLAAATAVGLIIRDQRSQLYLQHCVRISVGTPEQNQRLLRGLVAAGAAA